MERLVGITQNYAWGSHTLLASLRGETSSELPEAEIWFGAHRQAPSTLESGGTLLDRIAAEPTQLLGSEIAERYGQELPFLVKLLAADRPLSIQAHPTIDQARAGFAREDNAGLAGDAAERSFRDDNHKPELMAAITPFEALVGFRRTEDSVSLFRSLGAPEWIVAALNADGPVGVMQRVLAPATGSEQRLVAEAVQALVDGAAGYDGGEWFDNADLVGRLHSIYPGDPGIVIASLLNRIVLEPDDAVFLDSGNLHAYLGGLGVEVMANSDNVVRGGLTSKHVDVDTLLDIVRPESLSPAPAQMEGNTYCSAAPEFALTRVDPLTPVDAIGPAIVIGVRGVTTVTSETAIEIGPTEAVWIPYGETAAVATNGLGFSTQVRSTEHRGATNDR